MPKTLTEQDVFTGAVVVPVDGDAATATSVESAFQALANRTRNHENLFGAAGRGVKRPFQEVATTDALKAYPSPADGEIVLVTNSTGDTHGLFRYDNSQTGADVAPMIYKSTTAPGGWRAVDRGLTGVAGGMATLSASDGRLALNQMRGYVDVYTVTQQAVVTFTGTGVDSKAFYSWVSPKSYSSGTKVEVNSTVRVKGSAASVADLYLKFHTYQGSSGSYAEVTNTEHPINHRSMSGLEQYIYVPMSYAFTLSTLGAFAIRWYGDIDGLISGNTEVRVQNAIIRVFSP